MKQWTLFNLITALALLTTSVWLFAGEHEHEREHGRGTSVPVVSLELYNKECGSCHFAYQAGLLPARSWTKMMGELNNHFGENAELPAEQQQQITQYLQANAADKVSSAVSAKLLKRLNAQTTPLRITELPYFIKEHDEIPAKMVKDNPDVKSLSQCAACHKAADKGLFNENTVEIPNYGLWEDD